MSANSRGSLDLFSTSQTKGAFSFVKSCASPVFCSYNAPYFAYQKEGKFYGVSQGCCNHWDCARCGLLRAKKEYGRIVNGIELLSKGRIIYFITITCRGSTLNLLSATQGYLGWMNRFLTACRTRAKREGQDWYYVQVTERQRRGHPHSHILTTYCPHDLRVGTKENWRHEGGVLVSKWVSCYRSDWLQEQSERSGLGSQYDISAVVSAAAASRYVAKYMFKPEMMQADFPKGWKRVRYSQSFPQLPERETNAFILLSTENWRKLAQVAAVIATDSEETKQTVLLNLRGHDVLVG